MTMTDQEGEKVDAIMNDVVKDEGGSSNSKVEPTSEFNSLLNNADVKVIARSIEHTLKALLIQIGIAVRSRARLQNVLEYIRIKMAQSTNNESANEEMSSITKNSQIKQVFSTEDLIILQQFNLSPQKILLANQSGIPIQIGNTIPNYLALERECLRYRALTSQFIIIIDQARSSLHDALPIALEREAKQREEQRIKDEKDAADAADAAAKAAKAAKAAEEAEAKRVKDEADAAAAAVTVKTEQGTSNATSDKNASDAIVIDDDEDEEDDDVPLAGRPAAAKSGGGDDNTAIDLTDESPALKTVNLPSSVAAESQSNPSLATSTALPTDPVALLAQLTAAVSGSSNNTLGTETNSQPITIGGMENFDFSSFGLNNPTTSADPVAKDDGAGQEDILGTMSNDMNLDMNDPTTNTLDDGLGDVSLLNFNADQFEGVDLSFLNDLGGAGNSESDNNLLGNIDFSALLGGGGST